MPEWGGTGVGGTLKEERGVTEEFSNENEGQKKKRRKKACYFYGFVRREKTGKKESPRSRTPPAGNAKRKRRSKIS